MSSCGVMVCECNGPRCVTRDVFCVSCKLSNTQKCINSRCRQSYYGSVTFMESHPFIIAAMHSRTVAGLEVAQEKPPTNTNSGHQISCSFDQKQEVSCGQWKCNETVRQLFAFKLQSHYTLNTFNSIFNLDPVRIPPQVWNFPPFF